MNIEQLITAENNSSIEGRFLITEIEARPFKEKTGNYLSFILQDKTGRISGKVWENADNFLKIVKDDVVINMKGKVNLFSGRNQVIVENIETVEEDFDPGDFLISASENPKEMMRKLYEIFNELEDEVAKKIWDCFKEDNKFMLAFQNCPGGKGNVHHAYIYGLLEHTLSVMSVSKFYAEYFKGINKDIVILGAFLHDIGKLFSYDYKVAIKMTDIGRLHGHTVMGYHYFLNKLDQLIQDYPQHKEEFQEYKIVLGHIILSHHGTLVQHAVEEPMTREAMLVSSADHIDSEQNYMAKVMDGETKDNWTKYDLLRGKMFYNPSKVFKKVEEKEEPKKKIRKKGKKLYDYDENV